MKRIEQDTNTAETKDIREHTEKVIAWRTSR